MRTSNKKKVLLLDRNFYPIGAISWRRAMGKLFGGVQITEVVCEYSDSLGLLDPAVIRLINRAIPARQMRRKPRLTRKNIFFRDNYECQYCGDTKAINFTIDHVIPKSKGGTNSFENCTTACMSCNQSKGYKTLQEWGRKIRNKPITPIASAISIPRKPPKEWDSFIY